MEDPSRDAPNSLDNDVAKIFEPLLSELEHRDLRPTIYHYTTDIGLRDILKSGKLWLTDIFSLNDPSEVRHGYDMAKNVLDEETKDRPTAYRQFAADFKEALDARFEDVADYFLCSFSVDGDDLGQWRAYADDGRGFALGFDPHQLQSKFCEVARAVLSGKDIPNGKTFHVTYNDEKLASIHRQVIKRVLRCIPDGRNLRSNDLHEWWHKLLTKLASHVIDASLYFKHKAYLHEQEYRFLEVHPARSATNVRLRHRGHELVRYREFDWIGAGPSVLKEVVIGPGVASCKRAREYVGQCLRDYYLPDVPITCSGIPYRPR